MMTLPAPYYQDEWVTIFHADCRTLLDLLAFDVIVTDPPYGINYETGWDSVVDRATSIVGDDDTTLRDEALHRTRDVPALVFGSWKVQRPADTRQVLTWEKGDNAGMGDLALPWKPNTEEVYVLGTGFLGHRGTSVLRHQAPVTWASKGRVHPHEKPVDLLRALIGKCPAGVVLDPFMGSGTTLRAAKDLGRKSIGIEVDERYCEIAVRRLAQDVLQFD